MKQHSHISDVAAIAVIGMASRFPGANDLQTFWQNLCAGHESIRPLTDEEQARYQAMTGASSGAATIAVASMIDDVDAFDHDFFGISATEAQLMSPQHRLMLETAYHALEHAGLMTTQARQGTGIYCAVNLSDYLINNIAAAKDRFSAADRLQIEIGSDQCYASSLIAHKLNLHGPSLTVNTACSSSLVAVHLACRALLSYECDSALAGAANVYVSQLPGYQYQEGGVQAPDGHCRPFDVAANGTVFGSGAGMLVLKRLEDALADQDCIWAVIRGTAINNDGERKVGFTAPSVSGQAEVISSALSFADLTPDDISYIEAHGTGTALGDPIEIAALELALGQSAVECRIGSVKSNIGHLNCAAGIAGALKTILMLHHQTFVPSLHFQQPNPQIDFSKSRFQVQTRCEPWTVSGNRPRIAGVSSFGIGGTNAHVLFEEFIYDRTEPGDSTQIIRLSSQNATALIADIDMLNSWLTRAGPQSIQQLAAQLCRRDLKLPHRFAVAADSVAQLQALLADAGRHSAVAGKLPPRLVLLFAGQGTELAPALCELAEHDPQFRQQVDSAGLLLADCCGADLRQILRRRQLPADTAVQQPVLFTLQVLWAQYLIAQGMRPAALLGHSLGEYAAACVAGVFNFAQGVALVSQRGRLMQKMPQGRMLSAALTPATARQYCNEQLEIGLINSPDHVVFTGPVVAIEQLQMRLESQQIANKMLVTSHAFHSRSMEPMLEEFRQVLQSVRWQPPTIPFLSNCSGDWITPAQATDPAYWLLQLRQPVLCAENFARLADSDFVILEACGPGAMTKLAQLNQLRPQQIIRQPISGAADFAALRAALWCRGMPEEQALLPAGLRYPSLLPGRHFVRHRHWIRPAVPAQLPAVVPVTSTDPVLFATGWKTALSAEQGTLHTKQSFVVLTDTLATVTPLTGLLTAGGHQVTTTVLQFTPTAAGEEMLLTQAVGADLRYRRHVVVVLSTAFAARLATQQPEAWCHPLMLVFKVCALQTSDVICSVVTENYLSLSAYPPTSAGAAILTGQLRSCRHELPRLKLRQIDVGDLALDGSFLAGQLTRESTDDLLVHRDGTSWLRHAEPVNLVATRDRLDATSPYLLTGGLGDVGFQLALTLAGLGVRRLILPIRRPLPDRLRWPAMLAIVDSVEARMIGRIGQLEDLGIEIFCPVVDLTRSVPVSEWLAPLEQQLGNVAGVIHAAGVNDAGLLLHSELRDARSQFALKVDMTEALLQYFSARQLEFICLISSAIAATGAIGQSFYSAANAYLDQRVVGDKQHRLLSIGWAGWQDCGIGSGAGGGNAQPPLLLTTVPLLQHITGNALQGWRLTANVNPSTHWLMQEHRIKQVPVFPATGYLSLLATCCEQLFGGLSEHTGWQLADLTFLTLLYSRPDQQIELAIHVEPAVHGYQIRVFQPNDDKVLVTASVTLHSQQSVTRPEMPAGPWTRQLSYPGRLPQLDQNMTLGPRWHCLVSAQVNTHEAKLELQLDARFNGDLQYYSLHPALLDIGLGVAVSDCLLAQHAVIPVSMGKMVQFRPMTMHLYCHVQLIPETQEDSALVVLNANFYTAEGELVVCISDYRLRRVAQNTGSRQPTALPDHALLRPVLQPALGRALFRQILCSSFRGHLVVDSVLPELRQQQWQAVATELFGRTDSAEPALADQDSSIDLVRSVMKTMLGLDSLSDSADFFELGGHSLLASRILSQYRQQLGVSPGIDMMFELPTVSAQAALLDAMLRSRGTVRLPATRTVARGYVEGVI
ncbi:hypothetical protein A5320_02680 [Rheinheimera sp. SA_1]|uniref:type I polyketide synthase n=1 Tax=Rheinheimera sp. SA_1 TaxID=1827365 RepID=UPI0007FB966E|nr:type I polyketide synthase [Rheinheimera sp. SA_1]OBP16333.1 hypothetical protein A5320_02680 [Rheinheimera sp. SA_1]